MGVIEVDGWTALAKNMWNLCAFMITQCDSDRISPGGYTLTNTPHGSGT